MRLKIYNERRNNAIENGETTSTVYFRTNTKNQCEIIAKRTNNQRYESQKHSAK